MKIFALESSCDESAVALFDSARGIVSELVNTQIALHGQFGGVVPDLASREHLANFPALLERISREIAPEEIDLVAVTRGPGLAGCLALGIAYARAVALAWQKPLRAVNHLRGHLFSPFIPAFEAEPEAFPRRCENLFPHLGLVVSGGNTLLVSVDANRRVEILAQTVDDAAGEAFDKGAKLLGMPYPGGALIEKNALRARSRGTFSFPRGENLKKEPRFSFSGLKTSLRYRLEKMSDAELAAAVPEIWADYQDAIVAQLASKAETFLRERHFASLGLSGGVSNNKTLRAAFEIIAQKNNLPLLTARPCHTGDNAAMIAFATWFDAPDFAEKFAHFSPTEKTAFSFDPSLTIERR